MRCERISRDRPISAIAATRYRKNSGFYRVRADDQFCPQPICLGFAFLATSQFGELLRSGPASVAGLHQELPGPEQQGGRLFEICMRPWCPSHTNVIFALITPRRQRGDAAPVCSLVASFASKHGMRCAAHATVRERTPGGDRSFALILMLWESRCPSADI